MHTFCNLLDRIVVTIFQFSDRVKFYAIIRRMTNERWWFARAWPAAWVWLMGFWWNMLKGMEKKESLTRRKAETKRMKRFGTFQFRYTSTQEGRPVHSVRKSRATVNVRVSAQSSATTNGSAGACMQTHMWERPWRQLQQTGHRPRHGLRSFRDEQTQCSKIGKT